MFKPRGRFRKKKRNKSSKRPLKFRQIFVISIVIFMLLTAGGLVLINEGLKPTLMTYAETKTEAIAQRAITYAVGRQLEEVQDDMEFFHHETNDNGDVTAVTVDTAEVAMMQTQTTQRVQNFLTRLERGELVEFLHADDVDVETTQQGPAIIKFPLGQATNNALLSNLGPIIPVRFQLVGNVNSNIDAKLTGTEEGAINTVRYRAYIQFEVGISVIVPFATEPATITSDFLVADEFLPLDVPYYYNQGGGGEEPGFLLPSPEEEEQRTLQ